MKHRSGLLLILFICFLITLPSMGGADSNEHDYILVSTGNYIPVETTTEAGHLTRYYAYWYCSCNNGHTDLLPANDPLFGDRFVPHNYSIKANHQVSIALHHLYNLKCSVSGCTYFTPVEHPKMAILTDHGHTIEGNHRYTYICNTCTYTSTIERKCSLDCPVHIYKLKPETETE